MNYWRYRDKLRTRGSRDRTRIQRVRSDHNSIHAEGSPLRSKAWNRPRLYQRSVAGPEGVEITLLSCAIEVQQVGLITGSVVGEPGVNVRDRDLTEHSEPIACRFSFIRNDCGDKVFVHWRLIPLT